MGGTFQRYSSFCNMNPVLIALVLKENGSKRNKNSPGHWEELSLIISPEWYIVLANSPALDSKGNSQLYG